jgi:hypothetical protein
MKTNLGTNGPVLKHLAQSSETALDSRVLIEIFLATLAGILSYVAAVLTTVVEPAGLWQYVCLWICIANFIAACVFVALACRNFR